MELSVQYRDKQFYEASTLGMVRAATPLHVDLQLGASGYLERLLVFSGTYIWTIVIV